MENFRNALAAWCLMIASALLIMGVSSFAQQGTGVIPGGQGTYGPPMSTANGHVSFGNGAPPAINAGCGTGASEVQGTDTVFKFTSGTGAGATCTITFAAAWVRPPMCQIVSAAGAVPVYTVGTLNMVMTAASSTVYTGNCYGQPGG